MGTIPDINGLDTPPYASRTIHEQGYMNARRRHSSGANFAFSDGHAKWFKAPNNYQDQSISGVCYRSPKTGGATYANCAAWFGAVRD